MSDLKIPARSWVVVCDGANARILRNEGDAINPALQQLDSVEQPEPRSHELGTDRPGRVHQSVGGAHSSVETTDFHQQAEAAFLAHLAAHLDKSVADHQVTSIILVAPPKALGILRKCLTHATSAAITAEIAKDLAKLTAREIEQHLAV